MRNQTLFVTILVSFSLFISPAFAKRVALVIGNDDYTNVTKLQKAVNDAKAVASTVRDIGFQVIEKFDVNRRTFDQQLNILNSKIEAGDEVVFFFAGHGISVRGQNYLLPTDIPEILPGLERSVIKEAFSENEIIALLQERGAKVSILIIDACRNNPFPKEGTRSVGRSVGLGQRPNPPRNTFVLYSAGIGQEALDRLSDADQNPNSVFTRKLIPLLKTPGLSHVQMAKKLQIEVEQLALTTKSRHQQFPAFYDQVRGNFYLVPLRENPQTKTDDADQTLWKTIENSEKPSDFEFYLAEHPKGRYSSVAKLKIQRLAALQVPIIPKTKKLPKPKPVLRHFPRPEGKMKYCHESKIGNQTGRLCVSSVLSPQYGNRYGSINLSDNRVKTAWVEGAKGDGIGETLLLLFPSETDVKKISLANGYNKNRDIYRKNGRVREFIVRSSTGFKQTVKLKDTGKWQVLNLPPLGKVMWVSLSISKVYRGSKYRDTAVSEFRIK